MLKHVGHLYSLTAEDSSKFTMCLYGWHGLCSSNLDKWFFSFFVQLKPAPHCSIGQK